MTIATLKPEVANLGNEINEKPNIFSQDSERVLISKNSCESKKPETDIKVLFENLKKFVDEEKIKNPNDLIQPLGHAYVIEMVNAYYATGGKETKNEKQIEAMKSITRGFKTIYDDIFDEKEINSNIFISGFQAEICTILTLHEMNFTTYLPNREDDMEGKIDIWAIDENTNEAYPIQIKSLNKIKDPVVFSEGKTQNIFVPGYSKDEIGKISDSMIKYLNKRGQEIKFNKTKPEIKKPLVLFVPSGRENAEAMYNQDTAIPSPEYYGKLTDEFFDTIWY